MARKNEFIPALGYNWLTRLYDLAVKITMPEKRIRTRLMDLLDPRDDQFILEFGFGTGQNILLAYHRNPKVKLAGVDVDPKVRQIALDKLEKYGIRQKLDLYDGRILPYPDKSFDKVVSSLVFHHLENEKKLSSLKEIHRVLKPNGCLIIGDWGAPRSKTMRMVFYIVQFVDGFKTTSDNIRGLLPCHIKNAGFKNVAEVDFINTAIGTYSYYQATKE